MVNFSNLSVLLWLGGGGVGIGTWALFWFQSLFIRLLWNASFKNLSQKRMDVSSFELDLIFLVLQKVDRFHLCPVFNLHARSFYSRCFSKWGPWSSRSASPENVLAIQIVRPDPGSTKSESEAEIYPALWFNKLSRLLSCLLNFETTGPHQPQHTSRSLHLEI